MIGGAHPPQPLRPTFEATAADGHAGDLARRLAVLPAAEKARLLTGADNWRTAGSPELGLRPLTMSDGPSGARGTALDERAPSTCLPCPSGLGATWDPELVRDVAALLGAEARGKGIDVLLGPTINLMRTPLGGRGFECFAEDPELTARIAVGYVRGLQSAGVAAAVKHFAGNDSETGRWTYDARIADHVLREVYLAPFEACVREAGAWAVMAAYNAVNGHRMTEHAELLRHVLKREWGFGGVVMSDWEAVRSTAPAALGGLDLAMPGPNEFWGEALAAAVAAGEVPAEIIDDKVRRLLALARAVGAVSRPGDGPGGPGQERGIRATPAAAAALLRRATAASFVLLRNEGQVLPLEAARTGKVAVIGPNAVHPVIQGGGSAGVIPAVFPDLAGSLRDALGAPAAVTVAPGCRTWTTVPAAPPGSLTDPATGEPGMRLEFHAADGVVLGGERRTYPVLAWWNQEAPEQIGWGEPGWIVVRTVFTAATGGRHAIGAAGVGRLTISVDGSVLADQATPVPADPVEALSRPGEVRARVVFAEGQQALVEVAFQPAAGGEGPLSLRLGIAPELDEELMLAQAEEQARRADVAVVVVGPPEGAESEGFDRATLTLPGRQDELVRRVAAANPRTVVVLNAGMPVLMPWAGEVAAVIQVWLPGQAMGDALTDVLLGRAEPGGRLPVTFPAAEADCPVLHASPRGGRLEYAEGLLIGYRGYDASGAVPAFPFGHGLGYTTWMYERLSVEQLTPGQDLRARVRVRNTGARPGREVVQVYVAGPPRPGRPRRVLGGFATAQAVPGEVVEVTVTVPARTFAMWDTTSGRWTWTAGEFAVTAGRSSRDLRLSAAVRAG